MLKRIVWVIPALLLFAAGPVYASTYLTVTFDHATGSFASGDSGLLTDGNLVNATGGSNQEYDIWLTFPAGRISGISVLCTSYLSGTEGPSFLWVTPISEGVEGSRQSVLCGSEQPQWGWLSIVGVYDGVHIRHDNTAPVLTSITEVRVCTDCQVYPYQNNWQVFTLWLGKWLTTGLIGSLLFFFITLVFVNWVIGVAKAALMRKYDQSVEDVKHPDRFYRRKLFGEDNDGDLD